MKKVIIGLTLSSLLAVLLVSATASVALAAACPTNCSVIIPSNNCTYGGRPSPATETVYLYSTNIYTTEEACRTAMNAGDNTAGEQAPSAPTVVQDAQGLINLIVRIGDWAFAAVLVVSALFLIYAGFMWVTAGGNPEGATKARTMLTNALIGVVVALLARGLVQVIKSVIGSG